MSGLSVDDLKQEILASIPSGLGTLGTLRTKDNPFSRRLLHPTITCCHNCSALFSHYPRLKLFSVRCIRQVSGGNAPRPIKPLVMIPYLTSCAVKDRPWRVPRLKRSASERQNPRLSRRTIPYSIMSPSKPQISPTSNTLSCIPRRRVSNLGKRRVELLRMPKVRWLKSYHT